MKKGGKKRNTSSQVAVLSNSFSTGGGGYDFEHRVQAAFLLGLLVDGFSPILNLRIVALDFQAKRLGYHMDDLVVHCDGFGEETKLLCQAKHGVTIGNNPTFQEVISAAWVAFNQSNFNKNKDKLVLITGLIPKADVLRWICAQANASSNEQDFMARTQEANFSNNDIRKKLEVLKNCLKCANNSQALSDKDIWEFCKAFELLVFDLAYESSINEFLIRALIASNSTQRAADVWGCLIDCVGRYNTQSAHVTSEKLPDELKKAFDKKFCEEINEDSISTLSSNLYVGDFWAKLALVGAWDEKKLLDREFVAAWLDMPYKEVQKRIQEEQSQQHANLTFSDGVWRLKHRRALIEQNAKLYFDDAVECIFKLAVGIFCQTDKRIQNNGEFSILVPEGGAFDNSTVLREHLLNGLAILCNLGNELTSCSEWRVRVSARDFVNEVLQSADTARWQSINEHLVLFAEISPDTYLSVLENSIIFSPKIMENLFPKNSNNAIFDQNFISPILWSLERLAWIEKYFIKCIRILGEMATVKHEKTNWVNTPINSIVSILLPWHPQTLATVEKQKVAIKILQEETPTIAWKVIQMLLPGATTSTTGNNKPKYIVADIPQVKVLKSQVAELYNYYSALAVELAEKEYSKLRDLLSHIRDMDSLTQCKYLGIIISQSDRWNDEDKYPIWNALSENKAWMQHTKQQLHEDVQKAMTDAIKSTQPDDLRCQYRRVYDSVYIVYDEDNPSDFDNKWQHKREKQQQVVLEIFRMYGFQDVILFGEKVNNRHFVARNLGKGLTTAELKELLIFTQEEQSEKEFLASILVGFFDVHQLDDIKQLGIELYEPQYRAWILSCLPISNNLLSLVSVFLKENEGAYWKIVSIPSYAVDEDLNIQFIWGKLIENNRFVAAINLFGMPAKKTMFPCAEDIQQTLLTASQMRCDEKLDSDAVRNLIQVLQESEKRDIEKLSDIEFIYLPWLDERSEVKPRAIRYRIANEPDYFCDLMSFMYKRRNAKEHEHKISEEVVKRLSEILFQFSVVPGTDWEGIYNESVFSEWMLKVKRWGEETDRIEVVLHTVGNGLSYAKKSEDGLMDAFIMKELNDVSNEELRIGYYIGTMNQRGVTNVDPEGKPEFMEAARYNGLAEKAESMGYSRFSETLKMIANAYDAEGKHHIKTHKKEGLLEEED